MKPQKILNPSLLAADFTQLGKELSELEEEGIRWLHIDILDGNFAPNLSIGPDQVKQLRKKSDLFFDVHLMVLHPLDFIPRFIDAGADSISFHIEAEDDISECLNRLKEAGIKKGLVISPDTELEKLKLYLNDIDLITVMSVYPGFGGQKFIEGSLDRIKAVKEMTKGHEILVAADGGVNRKTIEKVKEAGTDIFIAGTAVFDGDKAENIKSLNKIIND